MSEEIGRPLKVTELKPETVVLIGRNGVLSSVWVVGVMPTLVEFYSGTIGLTFFARRTGPDLESLEDPKGPLELLEYLGEI